ncbi:unnamed protein product [Adineta steineri]|uniref:HMG box domain-containing protein n=1 Tax=Adineta steineri TaxID=433720 RepID=A0A819ZIE7_9BILA|nr:unnamed protein product [Adineta steineri]CAF4177489.1 unnamed protein product [Adineta steineri]
MPRKSKKTLKDPNAPKRPLSGYFLFARDERPKIKLIEPNLPTTDVMKMIGERWSNLDIDLKRQYGKLAAEEKLRYDQEMIVYRKEMAMKNSILPLENKQ